MTDFLYPQDGDYGDAADFASWVDKAGLYDYVDYGLDLTPDWANNQFDVAKGKAYIRAADETGARSGETREGVVYEAFIDARSNIDFASSSGVNYIWIAADRDTGDDIVVYVTANSSEQPKDENGNTIPGVKFAELDAARETVQYYNQGQDLEPQNLDFQGRLDDPASPSIGTQWFREDEGIHYVELPGGKQEIPVAREFQVEDFENESLDEYSGDTGDYSFDANSSEGTTGLRATKSSGEAVITNFNSTHAPQQGDSISFDVLIGSQYTTARFWYCVTSSTHSNDPIGYAIDIDSYNGNFELYRVDGDAQYTSLFTKQTSIIENEDEFITVSISWGEDGTHRATLTDKNGREVEQGEATDSTYTDSTGYTLFLKQSGSGTAEVIWDNIRTTRPIENHVLDAEDTLFMGGEQTVFEGAVNTGPLNAPKDSKGVHTDQPVTDSLTAGDEVGYLLGIGATDILDVYGEADGGGGVQNLAAVLRGDSPLRFEDENGDIVELRADGGELIVEDSAGNTTTLS
jgi:hypothetical protein